MGKPSKSKPRPRAAQPQKPDPYAGMSPARKKLHARADEISLQFSRLQKPLNRVLLAVFGVVVILWICGVIGADPARYLIIALLGVSLAVGGLSGYRQSRWAGSFLMIFGTLLAIGNLYMLGAG